MNAEDANKKKFVCENPKCQKEHDGSYGSGRFCSVHCRRVYAGLKSNQTMKKNGTKKCNFRSQKNNNGRAPYGTWKCKHCDEIFETKRLLYEHYHSKHNDKFSFGRSHQAWNKGLTKETDLRLFRASKKVIDGYQTGRLIASRKGKHHSKETKQRLIKIALAANYQRVTKHTEDYICKDGTIVRLDSSYERKLAKIFDDNDIKWIRPKPLVWYSNNGMKHHYYSDFYLIDYDLYIDPKNEYCFKVQAEKIQYIKEHYKNCIFLHKYDLEETKILKLLDIYKSAKH